jgi:hypothetical protein
MELRQLFVGATFFWLDWSIVLPASGPVWRPGHFPWMQGHSDGLTFQVGQLQPNGSSDNDSSSNRLT